MLSALCELPQAIVARELKLTKKAVEMRIRRARLRLREVLPGDPTRERLMR